MKYKMGLLVICLVICFFSVSCVFAGDVNENVTSTDDCLAASEDIQAMEHTDSEELAAFPLNDFSSLQKKIDDAEENSTVKLDVKYTYGPFDSGEIRIDKALTIDGNGHTIDALEKCRIFNVNSNGVVLKNIVFKNGHADSHGGAIYGECTVVDCTFEGNSAGYGSHGGAIFGNCTVVDCTFKGNSVGYGGNGGAIHGDCYVVDCTFEGNSVGYGASGGAIRYGSVVNCTFVGNFAYFGGAISDCSAMNCTFVGNSANDSGGAIRFGSAVNCTFVNNSAVSNGGAMCDSSAVNCTFVGNSANDFGGAMYVSYAVNCTFVGNSANDSGGAMYVSYAVNCTFTGNSAKDNGGAMFSGSAVNCDFTGNSAKLDGGAIFAGSADTCLFKDNNAWRFGDDMQGRNYYNPTLAVHDSTFAYGSGDKLTFDFRTNGGMKVNNRNVEVKIYRDNLLLMAQNCSSGDGVVFDFDLGTYLVVCRALEFDIESVNATVKIKKPREFDPGEILDVVKDGEAIISITGAHGFEGTVTAEIDEIKYDFTLVDGKGDFKTSNLSTGQKQAKIHVPEDEEYAPLTVLSNKFIVMEKTSFRALNREINGGGDIVILNHDYVYDKVTDFEFVNGIIVNGDLTVDGQGHSIDGNKTSRIFYVDKNADLTLINLTLKNAFSLTRGGAIYNGGNLTVVDSVLQGNNAIQSGGAIHNTGSLTATGSRIDENLALNNGGAICNEGALEIADSRFADNHANRGGVIYNTKELAINGSTFTNNAATGFQGRGGVICSAGDNNMTVENSKFKNNNATSGSVIWVQKGENANLNNDRFVDNGRNPLYAERGEIDVSRCKFLTEVVFSVNDISSLVNGSAITVNVSEVKKAGTFSGNVTAIIGDEEYAIEVINGFGNLTVTPNLMPGKHAVVVVFNETDVYDSASARSNEFQVSIMPEIMIADISDFEEGGSITVNLTASRYFTGDVDVLIGGVNYAVSVVDGIGSRTITPDLKAGDYVASISYAGNENYTAWNSKSNAFTVSAKTVAGKDNASQTPVSSDVVKLTLKKVKVKRSAKKLKLQATLKVNGKAVKGKKVTFKFNGKTYRAKTNKKGIAKVTIKSKVLKKLKVGKKVKYQAGYGKTVVRKTAVVKR